MKVKKEAEMILTITKKTDEPEMYELTLDQNLIDGLTKQDREDIIKDCDELKTTNETIEISQELAGLFPDLTIET